MVQLGISLGKVFKLRSNSLQPLISCPYGQTQCRFGDRLGIGTMTAAENYFSTTVNTTKKKRKTCAGSEGQNGPHERRNKSRWWCLQTPRDLVREVRRGRRHVYVRKQECRRHFRGLFRLKRQAAQRHQSLQWTKLAAWAPTHLRYLQGRLLHGRTKPCVGPSFHFFLFPLKKRSRLSERSNHKMNTIAETGKFSKSATSRGHRAPLLGAIGIRCSEYPMARLSYVAVRFPGSFSVALLLIQ